ncbi:MAG: creatininase family protein [Alphaproteobacteria bacterium]|nr:creatininase family protein [Alphaproteobacteria bacterium]MCW5738980.1 creatininase family protein [Alphaproteobacteria bacterium]
MDLPLWLEDLTWLEAKTRFEAGDVLILPIGAAAKEHGPHLPLRTDATTARAYAERLARRARQAGLPTLIAPLVPFGYYPAFTRYAGSQHLSAATFSALLRELIEGFIAQGAHRLLLLNTGVSTEAPINALLGEIHGAAGVRVVAAHLRFLGRDADKWIEVREGGHADERETSVMLAIDGRSVRMDRLPDAAANAERGMAGVALPAGFARPVRLSPDAMGCSADEFAPSGATGDASRATAYKGERVIDAVIEDLLAGLVKAFR